MKIYLGYDHAGQALKDMVYEVANEMQVDIEDLGSHGDLQDDYPDFAVDVAEKVAKDPATKGVLICGAGAGMAIAANKVPGVRAAFANNVEIARLIRAHNDANILTLGGRMTDGGTAKAIIKTFLTTDFEGGRHERRVNKISALEQKV
ncbi:MAG: ribose 5-phosphate isomerase B [Candidatus Abawacabacteria bacterium]|nr:ribose 5-phosphate isomerase B [Candidatus Abawacabacteria bacterium]